MIKIDTYKDLDLYVNEPVSNEWEDRAQVYQVWNRNNTVLEHETAHLHQAYQYIVEHLLFFETVGKDLDKYRTNQGEQHGAPELVQ